MFKFEEYPQIKKAHETYEKMSNGSYKAELKYNKIDIYGANKRC